MYSCSQIIYKFAFNNSHNILVFTNNYGCLQLIYRPGADCFVKTGEEQTYTKIFNWYWDKLY